MDLIESMDSSSIRVDNSSKTGSVKDVIRMVLGCSSSAAATTLSRLFVASEAMVTRSESIVTRCHNIRIQGKGKPTPCADAKTLMEIVWLLPGKKAHAFRRQSSEKVCRLLGGDLSLVSEIEARHATLQSTEEGRATQDFLLNDTNVVTDHQSPAKKIRSDEPYWFQHASDEEKRAFVSVMAAKATVVEQVDMYDICKRQLESVNQFSTRDEIEFADRVKDAQRRASRASNMLTAAAVDNTAVTSAVVARPVNDTIDPATGLLIPTPRCSESVRGPETSICNEAAKLGIAVGEKAGQVGKVLKSLYSKRYGVKAGQDIPKRPTTYRGKPFDENCYWSRDADLIQEAIRMVCVPEEKPRQLTTTQTLLKWIPGTTS